MKVPPNHHGKQFTEISPKFAKDCSHRPRREASSQGRRQQLSRMSSWPSRFLTRRNSSTPASSLPSPPRLVAVKKSKKAPTPSSSSSLSSTEIRLAAKIGETLVCRYGPYPTRSTLVTRLYALPSEQRNLFRDIKTKWLQEAWPNLAVQVPNQQQPWSDEMILRVSIWVRFDVKRAISMLQRMHLSHWDTSHPSVTLGRLDAATLEEDFASRAVLPLPHVRVVECYRTTQPHARASTFSSVLYVKPSRFFAVTDPLQLITYTMNFMYDRHGDDRASCRLTLLINLKGYYIYSSRMQETFHAQHWIALLQLLQGQRGPVRAAQVLFVNVPSEFKGVWETHLQSHCHHNFASRCVYYTKPSRLDQYLAPGFEQGLPKQDFRLGQASTRTLVQDFVAYRKALEQILLEQHETAMRRKAVFTRRIRQDLQEQQKEQAKFTQRESDESVTENESSFSSFLDGDEEPVKLHPVPAIDTPNSGRRSSVPNYIGAITDDRDTNNKSVTRRRNSTLGLRNWRPNSKRAIRRVLPDD